MSFMKMKHIYKNYLLINMAKQPYDFAKEQIHVR